MSGTADNPGLNVRILKELFREREVRRGDTDIKVALTVTEIYNETIKDLFATKQKKLDVKTNPDGCNTVPGVTELVVESVEDVIRAMEQAQSNRSVMATDMNEESSRSHSIVQVRTTNTCKKQGREYIGKINLVDLAGSENVNKSGVSGQGMREAQNINKSPGRRNWLFGRQDTACAIQELEAHNDVEGLFGRRLQNIDDCAMLTGTNQRHRDIELLEFCGTSSQRRTW